jgi:hypothetical protein
MENENLTPAPITSEVPTQTPIVIATENRPVGAFIGTIIVIVILVLGGLYLWSTNIQPKIDEKLAPQTEQQTIAKETAATNVAVEQLATQSQSDETASIESDLNATDLSNIDKDLQAI